MECVRLGWEGWGVEFRELGVGCFWLSNYHILLPEETELKGLDFRDGARRPKHSPRVWLFRCGSRHRVLSDTVFEFGTGMVASILAFRHKTHEGLLL